jgi:phosphatidylserine synthase
MALEDPPQNQGLGFPRGIAARGAFGVASVVSAELGAQAWAALLLAAAVCGDLVVEAIAKRRYWERRTLELHLESLVDFVSFIWAPVALTLAAPHPIYLVWLSALFIAAGVFRIVRFNVEGLVDGGYRGLPVTYNGAIFPLALVASWSVDGLSAGAAFTVAMLVTTILMPCGAFVVPQIRP